MKLCNILQVEMHTGGCGYGNKRLCCKSCVEKGSCMTVCTKAYELEGCVYEEECESCVYSDFCPKRNK